MYRITGTRFYSEHGRIVSNGGDAAIATIAIAVSETKKKEKKNTKVEGWWKSRIAELRTLVGRVSSSAR